MRLLKKAVDYLLGDRRFRDGSVSRVRAVEFMKKQFCKERYFCFSSHAIWPQKKVPSSEVRYVFCVRHRKKKLEGVMKAIPASRG